MTLRIAVLASVRGSNLQAILQAIGAGTLDAEVVGVFSDKPAAPALRQVSASRRWSARPSAFPDRAAYEAALSDAVAAVRPDWVVCAGYLRILGDAFIARFRGRLLNIHPSLLPRDRGLHTHARAIEAGDAEHGADAAENAQDVCLIDYENIDANDWCVTNQFSIDGKSTRRPDIVLLINGIPIVVIEAKTGSRSKPDWREGAKQLGMYAEEIDQLFYTNAYGVGVNETRMMYGVPGRRLQFWLQWRDPWPHEIDEFDEMKVSLYGLFDRGNLLDFIRHFIVFVTKDGKTEKVVVRYQQYLAEVQMELVR